MKDFFKQIFSDVDGQGSSKRIAVFIILALLVTAFIGVFFFHATFQAQMWEDMKYTFWLMMGFITGEKFTNRKPDSNNDKT